MPLMSIADQKRLPLLRKVTRSVNPILSTLGILCDFRALAAVYNINCGHVSNTYIINDMNKRHN